MGGLIPIGKVSKLFPEVSKRTLYFWAKHAHIDFSSTTEDGRGTGYLFSADDIVKLRKFIDDRLQIRTLYRIGIKAQ